MSTPQYTVRRSSLDVQQNFLLLWRVLYLLLMICIAPWAGMFVIKYFFHPSAIMFGTAADPAGVGYVPDDELYELSQSLLQDTDAHRQQFMADINRGEALAAAVKSRMWYDRKFSTRREFNANPGPRNAPLDQGYLCTHCTKINPEKRGYEVTKEVCPHCFSTRWKPRVASKEQVGAQLIEPRPCPLCLGAGTYNKKMACAVCAGDGYLGLFELPRACRKCEGRGHDWEDTCDECNGFCLVKDLDAHEKKFPDLKTPSVFGIVCFIHPYLPESDRDACPVCGGTRFIASSRIKQVVEATLKTSPDSPVFAKPPRFLNAEELRSPERKAIVDWLRTKPPKYAKMLFGNNSQEDIDLLLEFYVFRKLYAMEHPTQLRRSHIIHGETKEKDLLQVWRTGRALLHHEGESAFKGAWADGEFPEFEQRFNNALGDPEFSKPAHFGIALVDILAALIMDRPSPPSEVVQTLWDDKNELTAAGMPTNPVVHIDGELNAYVLDYGDVDVQKKSTDPFLHELLQNIREVTRKQGPGNNPKWTHVRSFGIGRDELFP